MSSIRITLLGDDVHKLSEELRALGAEVLSLAYDPEKLLEPFSTDPLLIICLPPTGMSETEVAQSVRMNYPDTELFYVTFGREKYNKRLLIKNGFSDTFFLPWEMDELRKKITSENRFHAVPEMKGYVSISPEDLFQDSVLSFPVKIHLSMNNKFLPFAQAEENLSVGKMSRLREGDVQELFIHGDDQEKFEAYVKATASRVSTNTRRRHLCDANRELVAEVLIDDQHEKTYDKARELMDMVKALVKDILLDTNGTFLEKIFALSGKNHSFYNHLTNVCAFAGYISLALNHENPEDIALAGLFHDIGKLVPAPTGDTDPLSWSKNHPQRSIDLLKGRRMVLSELTQRAIVQHHEAPDGSGFPKGLSSVKVSLEGKIVAIADRLDHLTSRSKDFEPLKPYEAFEKMLTDNSGANAITLDTEILRKLKNMSRG